jgi:hypothetical protein
MYAHSDVIYVTDTWACPPAIMTERTAMLPLNADVGMGETAAGDDENFGGGSLAPCFLF